MIFGTRKWATIAGVAVLLAGCDFVDGALIPTLTGEDPAAKSAATEQPTAPATAPSTDAQRATTIVPTTGTPVGERVKSLRNDVLAMQRSVNAESTDYQRLRQSSNDNVQKYQAAVADTQTKLRLGTTAGNPELVRAVNGAEGTLDQMAADIEQMNKLTDRVADDSSMAAFILQSVDATFKLSGAVDEDHAQLKVLEDDTKRTQVLITRLTNELSQDIPRQTNFVARERANLAVLSAAVNTGTLPETNIATPASAPAASAPAPAAPAANLANRRPFVVIRFDRDDVAYEEPLFNAVQQALDRRPSAVFDLVSVVPQQGTPEQVALNTTAAERNAERVMRSLTEMGLPSERISLSALSSNEATASEVQVYVR